MRIEEDMACIVCEVGAIDLIDKEKNLYKCRLCEAEFIAKIIDYGQYGDD